MGKAYIENRVIQAGKELCERRIGQKGTMITADDIRSLKVRTFSPVMQLIYIVLGVMIFVLGLWVQMTRGMMAISIGLVLVGFLNVAFGVNGRPRAVSRIGGLDLMALTAEVVGAGVKEQGQETAGRD